jgi:hypothetical protein
MAAAPMSLRNKIIITVAVTVLGVFGFGYMTYKDLGLLGRVDPSILQDPTEINCRIPPFLLREGDGTAIWSNIGQTVSDIAVQQKIIDTRPAVEAKLAELQGQIVKAQERLPREQEKAEMRQLIENLARDVPSQFGQPQILGVTIGEESGPNRTPNLRSVIFSTDLTGSTNGIIAYIDAIEKNPRFMTVSKITIDTGGLNRDPTSNKVVHLAHKVHLDIISYVYNPPVKK